MAISVGSNITQTSNVERTYGYDVTSHTVESGTKMLVVCILSEDNSGIYPSGVTWNSDPMTEAVRLTNGTYWTRSIFVLADPDTGNNTLSITFSGKVDDSTVHLVDLLADGALSVYDYLDSDINPAQDSGLPSGVWMYGFTCASSTPSWTSGTIIGTAQQCSSMYAMMGYDEESSGSVELDSNQGGSITWIEIQEESGLQQIVNGSIYAIASVPGREVKSIIKAITQAIGSIPIRNVTSSIISSIQVIGSIITKAFKVTMSVVESIGTVSKLLFTSKFITAIVQTVGSTSRNIYINIIGTVQSIGSIVTKTFKTIVSTTEAIGSIFTKTFKSILSVIENIGTISTRLFTSEVVIAIVQTVGSTSRNIYTNIIGTVQSIGSISRNISTNIIGIVQTVGSAVGQLLTEVFYKTVVSVVQIVGSTSRNITTSIIGTVQSIGSIVTKTFKTIVSTTEAIGSIATQLLTEVFYKTVTAVVQTIGFINRNVVTIISATINVVSKIRDRIIFDILSIVQVVGSSAQQFFGVIYYQTVTAIIYTVAIIEIKIKTVISSTIQTVSFITNKVSSSVVATVWAVGFVIKWIVGEVVGKCRIGSKFIGSLFIGRLYD